MESNNNKNKMQKMRHMTVMLPEEIYENLRSFAKIQGVTFSTALRTHLEFAVAQRIG